MGEFYLRDTRSNVGTSCMFWAKNGAGYTSNLDDAELFTQERSQRYADEKRHFIPLSKPCVDKVTSIRIDSQYIEGYEQDFSQGVLIHYKGLWDGNDIYFDSGQGKTVNYCEAKVFTEEEAVAMIIEVDHVLLSKVFLDSIARRTLQSINVSHRKMMTAAGIKYRKPRKSRAVTGKSRSNCPSCGEIVWNYNSNVEHLCERCDW